MGNDKRQADRVRFERGYGASIEALDGTWQRRCLVGDVSQTGAKLMILGPMAGLDLNDFFLILSSTGPIRRRCKMAWVNGDAVGVRFTQDKPPVPVRDRRKRRPFGNQPTR